MSGVRIRSRGPMGGAAWSPADLPGLELWLKADAGVLNDGDGVYEWQDQSVNGRHFAQATGPQKPGLIPDARNGLSVVRFDGVDDSVTFGNADDAGWFSSTAISLYAVIYRNGNVAGLRPFHLSARVGYAQSHNLMLSFGVDPNHLFYLGNTSPNTVTESLENRLFINSWLLDSATTSEVRVDGVQRKSVTQTFGDPWANQTRSLGRYGSGGGFFDGDFCELIVVSAKHDATQAGVVEAYLATKWGVSI